MIKTIRYFLLVFFVFAFCASTFGTPDSDLPIIMNVESAAEQL